VVKARSQRRVPTISQYKKARSNRACLFALRAYAPIHRYRACVIWLATLAVVSIPPFAAYLFDVDGTLVDSAPDICGAIQDVLVKLGRSDISNEFLRGYIGRHLVDVFTDIFPSCPSSEIEEMIADYRRIYPARNHAATGVYPGVREAMQQLGGRKSTATTKGTPTTRLVLDKFGLLSFFDHVQGTDGFPAKPHPDVILAAMSALGVEPGNCLMVGDAASDMEAAKRAGVKSCAVTYGYGTYEALSRWEPDYWISDLRELAAYEGERPLLIREYADSR
jgi:phosphoglycolate phosphatase